MEFHCLRVTNIDGLVIFDQYLTLMSQMVKIVFSTLFAFPVIVLVAMKINLIHMLIIGSSGVHATPERVMVSITTFF